MDKRTLQLFSMLLIPGFGMLYTLISPTFLNVINPTFSIPVRVVFTILSLVIGILSVVLILTKSYSTIDSLKDARDKKEIDKISNIIDDYIKDNIPNYQTSIDKETIKEWITEWLNTHTQYNYGKCN